MGHTDGHGTLGLAGIHGNDAAANRLGHIGAGIDGHNHDGRHPDGAEAQGIVAEVRKTVEQKDRLQHHGGTAEDLDIDPDDHPDQLQNEALYRMVAFRIGNRIQHTADKADEAADQGADQGEDQGVLHAGEIGCAVFTPEFCDIKAELSKFTHSVCSPH